MKREVKIGRISTKFPLSAMASMPRSGAALLNSLTYLPRDYSGFIRLVQQPAGRSVIQATQQTQSSTSGKPMQISAISGLQPASPLYARSISPARQNQYRVEESCMRCGTHNHWVRYSPLPRFSQNRKPEGYDERFAFAVRRFMYPRSS